MRMTRSMLVCVVAATVLPVSGCNPNPNQGFVIATEEGVESASGGLSGTGLPMMETAVSGQYVPSGDYPNPSGNVSRYDGFTSGNTNSPQTLGTYYVSNGIATAYWDNEVWFPNTCNYPLTPGAYLVSTNFLIGYNEFEIDDVVMENTGINGAPSLTWVCLGTR